MTMTTTTLNNKAKPRGKYPHIKRVGDLIFVSGVSSRNPDGSFRGAVVDSMGNTELNIAEQTKAVLDNINDILGKVKTDSRNINLENMSNVSESDIEQMRNVNLERKPRNRTRNNKNEITLDF